MKKRLLKGAFLLDWSGRHDSNMRPSGLKPDAFPEFVHRFNHFLINLYKSYAKQVRGVPIVPIGMNKITAAIIKSIGKI